MHVPTRRMDCWTDTATERPWLFQDRYRIRRLTPEPVDGARRCRAWDRATEDRQRINGSACDGCARLEGEE
jgi:hypothetical protein